MWKDYLLLVWRKMNRNHFIHKNVIRLNEELKRSGFRFCYDIIINYWFMVPLRIYKFTCVLAFRRHIHTDDYSTQNQFKHTNENFIILFFCNVSRRKDFMIIVIFFYYYAWENKSFNLLFKWCFMGKCTLVLKAFGEHYSSKSSYRFQSTIFFLFIILNWIYFPKWLTLDPLYVRVSFSNLLIFLIIKGDYMKNNDSDQFNVFLDLIPKIYRINSFNAKYYRTVL